MDNLVKDVDSLLALAARPDLEEALTAVDSGRLRRLLAAARRTGEAAYRARRLQQGRPAVPPQEIEHAV